MSINGRRNAINVGCAEAINLMVEEFQGIYIYIEDFFAFFCIPVKKVKTIKNT